MMRLWYGPWFIFMFTATAAFAKDDALVPARARKPPADHAKVMRVPHVSVFETMATLPPPRWRADSLALVRAAEMDFTEAALENARSLFDHRGCITDPREVLGRVVFDWASDELHARNILPPSVKLKATLNIHHAYLGFELRFR